MTMTELYEQDRERLLQELENAGDPVRSQAVLGSELDRILFRYNEQCADGLERQAASYMIQTARMALCLTDTAGEVKVWERRGQGLQEDRHRRLTGLSLVLLAAGIVSAAFVFALTLRGSSGADIISLAAAAALLTVSVACSFLAGNRQGQPAARKRNRQSGAPAHDQETPARRTEISVDAAKLCRGIHSVLLTIDRNLADIRSAAGWEKRTQAGHGNEPDGKTLELCAGLLEAEASGDGALALEKLDDVRFFLHERGIEAVPYSREHEDWFDLLPGTGSETVRPALAAEGVLLKKGLAVGGR